MPSLCFKGQPLLALVLLATLFLPPQCATEVAVMHYGHFGGLSITCQRDQLILMQSEVLGYSTNRGCNPQPLCSVPYTLAKWYCRGKSTCGGMQVERRPLHKRTCGSEFTNCLRVEYQCVPMTRLTDICSSTLYKASDGYLSSPSFPEMYPPEKNCTCSLRAPPNQHVQIDSAFFLLKSSRPCRDWLRITADNDETTKCGYVPEQKRFLGQEVTINFKSDAHDTEMGFWLRFSGTGGGEVSVRCGRYVNMDESVTPAIKAPGQQRSKKTLQKESGSPLSGVTLDPTTQSTTTETTPVEATPQLNTTSTATDMNTTESTTTPSSSSSITKTEATASPKVPTVENKDNAKDIVHGVAMSTSLTSTESDGTRPEMNTRETPLISDHEGKTPFENNALDEPKNIEAVVANLDSESDGKIPTLVLNELPLKEDGGILLSEGEFVDLSPGLHEDEISVEAIPKADTGLWKPVQIMSTSPEPPKTFGEEERKEEPEGHEDKGTIVWSGNIDRVNLEPDRQGKEFVAEAYTDTPDRILWNPVGHEDDIQIVLQTTKPKVQAPIVHSVHQEQISEQSEPVEASEDNINRLLSDIDQTRTMELTTQSLVYATYDPMLPVQVNEDIPDMTKLMFPEAKQSPAEGGYHDDDPYPDYADEIDYPADSGGLLVGPTSGEDIYKQSGENTGLLLPAPTEFPKTLESFEENAPTYKTLQRLVTPEEQGGNVQSMDESVPKHALTPQPTNNGRYTWRAIKPDWDGDPYMMPRTTPLVPRVPTTTQEEMLHYVHSGLPLDMRKSFATGEFRPAGDIISLIDEKDLTIPTQTTSTTTRSPEIITLGGNLAPQGPINTIGKPFRPANKPTPGPSPTEDDTSPTAAIFIPLTPADTVAEVEKWPPSNRFNLSWLPPPMIYTQTYPESTPADDNLVNPKTEEGMNSAAVSNTSQDKDLMWVLVIIAIILWVIFMALLALLVYHRRRRLPCLREDNASQASSDSHLPISKNMFLPPALTKPYSPAQRTFFRPPFATSATQTSGHPRNQEGSMISWDGSESSYHLPPELVGHSGQTSPMSWSAPWSATPGPITPSPVYVHAAYTQTQDIQNSGTQTQTSSSAQTDVSGTLSRHGRRGPSASRSTRSSVGRSSFGHCSVGRSSVGPASASYSHPSRRNAPLPPLPSTSKTQRHPKDTLRQIPPITYINTIMRTGPTGKKYNNPEEANPSRTIPGTPRNGHLEGTSHRHLATESAPHRHPAPGGAPHRHPAPEGAPHRHPAPEGAPHRHPAPEGAPHRHPAPEGAPHRNLALESAPHRNLALEGAPHRNLAAKGALYSHRHPEDVTMFRADATSHQRHRPEPKPMMNPDPVSHRQIRPEESIDLTNEINSSNVSNWALSNLSNSQPRQQPVYQGVQHARNPGYTHHTTNHPHRTPKCSPKTNSATLNYHSPQKPIPQPPLPPAPGYRTVEEYNAPSRQPPKVMDLPLPPPPPPELLRGHPSPTPTCESTAKYSINSSIRDNSSYSTIKKGSRHPLSSVGSEMFENPFYWNVSMSSIASNASGDRSANIHWVSNPSIDTDLEPEVPPFHPGTEPGGQWGAATSPPPPPTAPKPKHRDTAPVIDFPPPPPPIPPPPIPPPLPKDFNSSLQQPHSNSSGSESSEASNNYQNARSHPIGCEDIASKSKTLKHVPARVETPEEKLKGLVPQQALFFNDRVQPELRRILSKRRMRSEPVQV